MFHQSFFLASVIVLLGLWGTAVSSALGDGASLSLSIGEIRGQHQLIDRYQLKTDTTAVVMVEVFSIAQSSSLAKRSQANSLVRSQAKKTNTTAPQIRVDLTPGDCTKTVCYPGAWFAPQQSHCDEVIRAQHYNSRGSLTAYPGTFVIVYSQTCGVVFQNPNRTSPYALDYNWAKLGSNAQDLWNKCFTRKQLSTGGVCIFENYLDYTFDNVFISLQGVSTNSSSLARTRDRF